MDDVVSYYMSEACAYYAIAMHQLTNMPLVVLFDDANMQSWGDKDEEEPTVVHVMVTDGKFVYDIVGRRTKQDIINHYHDVLEPRFEVVSINELKSLMGDDRPLYKYSSKEIQEARKVALKQRVAWDGYGSSDPDVRSNPVAEIAAPMTKAFKKWFGNSKVVNERGRPLVVYHWSKSDKPFSRFVTESENSLGAHFGTRYQAEYLRKYRAQKGGYLYKVYLRIENPLRMLDGGQWTPLIILRQLEVMKEFARDVRGMADRYKVEFNDIAKTRHLSDDNEGRFRRLNLDYHKAIIRLITEHGYDGVVYRNRVEGLRLASNGRVATEKQIVGLVGSQTLSWPLTKTDEEIIAKGLICDDSYIVIHPNQIKSATDNVGSFSLDDPDIRMNPVSHSELLAGARRADAAGDVKSAELLRQVAKELR